MSITVKKIVYRRVFLLCITLLMFCNSGLCGQPLLRAHLHADKIILDVSETILGRDLLFLNQTSATSFGSTGHPGDWLTEPEIYRIMESDGKIVLRFIDTDEYVGSDYASHNMIKERYSQPVFQSFSYEKVEGRYMVDITDWISNGAYRGTISKVVRVDNGDNRLTIIAERDVPGSGVLQVGSNIVLLNETLMRGRYADPRIGYFTSDRLHYDDNASVEKIKLISRWRLEPHDEDMAKYRRGQAVVPKEPIVFYIDPYTPSKWIPYIKKAINAWQPVLEKVGFKGAIEAREAPVGDSTWSIESCRAAIMYKPSSVENAFGQRYADPRSGEIVHARIQWHHSLIEWLKGNYMMQAGPSDSTVFDKGISDEWLGELIGCIVTHEVGHTLGLIHNMGSSSVTPVEKLRDNRWLKKNGHSTSIMDYSRFNYVAQPNDKIDHKYAIPRIGSYDYWAIEWGYRYFPTLTSAESERDQLDKMVARKQSDPRCWFGGELYPGGFIDPRAQSEDLSNDLVKATNYGMRNLKFVMQKVDKRDDFKQFYDRIISMQSYEVYGQYYNYTKHLMNVVGGVHYSYDTDKVLRVTPVSAVEQQRAIRCLGEHVFKTPYWLLDPVIAGRMDYEPIRFMRTLHSAVITLIFRKTYSISVAEANNPDKAYTMKQFIDDMSAEIFTELSTGEIPDLYRQSLQLLFVRQLLSGANTSSDGAVISDYFKRLKSELEQAISHTTDSVSKLHYQNIITII